FFDRNDGAKEFGFSPDGVLVSWPGGGEDPVPPKPNEPPKPDPPKPEPLKEGDISALINAGVIAVSVTGNSIDFTSVKLTNKTNREITATIPLGTYFNSNSSSVQNMVVRKPITVTIAANESKSISVATACMNIAKDIPGSNNGFGVSALDTDSKLMRVMKLLEENNASYAVTQAAVWIVTDNPSDYDLLNTLVYSGGGRAISEDDLKKAREIVRLAG
ncbi:MAG: thioester domain-containing protein, partial [Oscillospiraceae bacterium]|nr:thioester domain-containing protein [Oscillospiraceae bacterium]